jgi:hypothetical protein
MRCPFRQACIGACSRLNSTGTRVGEKLAPGFVQGRSRRHRTIWRSSYGIDTRQIRCLRAAIICRSRACLDVFDSLTPALLGSTARPLFEAWLDKAGGRYFVMQNEESIVGCDGYSFSPDKSIATLRWGMIHRCSKGMGLGRFLLMYRIREIGRAGTAGMVLVHAPLPSAVFYEKQGFRVNGTDKEGCAAEFDCVEMIKKLTVCP